MVDATARTEAARLRALVLRSQHDALVDRCAAHAGASSAASALVVRLGRGEALPEAMLRQETLPFTLALATAWGGMARTTDELAAAVATYEQVLDRHGPRALPSADQRHAAQAAYLAGRFELVEDLLGRLDRLTEAVTSGLRADVANPVLGGPGARSHPEWERLFGERFVARGMAAPRVGDGAGCLFDGLHLAPGRPVDGPLVSVIVPAYRPEEGLLTSVRSILAQSHEHLEVLLVDDCSGEGYAELFARAEALDERVRLVRQERNGGSYLARNAALVLARGELVTTQDADDWSHPERLAAQVALMAEHPDAVASRSAAIRCRPDLTRQWFGYSPERMNASSLMIRREVLEGVGGFDAIRKGADSEMYERLGLLAGGVVDVAAPLAVTRLAAGSLSRADFTFGRHSSERVLFRSAFRRWHESLGHAESLSVADARARREGQSPFPVPRSFVRDLPGVMTPRTDHPVVLLVDLADPLPAGVDDRLREWVLGGGDGARLAVLGREDLTRGSELAPSWRPVLLDAAREGRMELLTDADGAHAGTLVALEPSLLALPALPLPLVSADRVVVCAIPPGEGEPVRDLEGASAMVREHFGRTPEWVARGTAEQQIWAAEGWRVPLLLEELSLRSAS